MNIEHLVIHEKGAHDPIFVSFSNEKNAVIISERLNRNSRQCGRFGHVIAYLIQYIFSVSVYLRSWKKTGKKEMQWASEKERNSTHKNEGTTEWRVGMVRR